jgi:methyltransferase
LTFVLLLVLAYVPMLVEARRAAANERAQLAAGGVEAPGDVYRRMRIAYPMAFAVMIAEGALRGAPRPSIALAGAALFVAAKVVKWWAIATLGRAWTFRVITVPAAPLVKSGPYAFVRHPNYVGVIGELIGVALMAGAWFAGPVGTLGFGLLIRQRIAVEERALDAAHP